MKVLWFTNTKLSDNVEVKSGSWVSGLYDILNEYTDVHIDIVTKSSDNTITEYNYKDGSVFCIPIKRKCSPNHIGQIKNIIERVCPDIIQVWGTEDVWGTIPFNIICPQIPTVLDMQGIISTVEKEFWADLTLKEKLRCWTLKEFLKPSSSIEAMKHEYAVLSQTERTIIKKFTNISCQSEWVKAYVSANNPDANVFSTGIALRKEFYTAEKWNNKDKSQLIIFSTAINSQPLKGLYTLMKAFAIVHKRIPNSKMILAGVTQYGIRRGGFNKMLSRYVKQNGLADAVEYVGALDANQLISRYLQCSLFVNPSFVESYSMVVAEAMYLGVPVVASYSGAMGELGADGSVLYFPKGDAEMCAYQILKIFQNSSLAKSLSEKSISIAIKRQDRAEIANKQIAIYNALIKSDGDGK